MEKIKAILIVKDQEPKVVEIDKDLKAYIKVIDESLTEEERAISGCNGLDFFSSKVKMVGGMVEEYSACHPYGRNRDWHGPALFTERDMDGNTVSMSEENIQAMLDTYSLENSKVKSKSKYLNKMLEKYGEQVVFNYSQGQHLAVLNTLDAKDAILGDNTKGGIEFLERIFRCIELENAGDEKAINEDITSLLKDVCIDMFKHQIKQFEFFGF